MNAAVLGLGALAAAGWLAVPTAKSLQRFRHWAQWPGRVPPAARPRLLTGASVAAALVVMVAAGSRYVVPVGVAIGLAVVVVRRLQAGKAHRRAGAARERDVRVLRALAAELRAGLSPVEAIRAVAGEAEGSDDGEPSLHARLAQAATVEALGGDPGATIAAAPGAGPALAAAWAVSRRSGAPLAEPVRRIAEAAADDLRIAREVDAALAAARSSAQLLALLPLAGALLGALSGTGALRLLITTGVGQVCLVAGVALDLAGLAWLDRMAARAAR